VLVLDLDAHCGGGTASLIAGEPRIWQVDVSVDGFDWYQSSDQIQLALVEDPAEYMTTIHRKLDDLDRLRIDFDLCLYNAGMDPFEDCLTGGLRGITREVLSDREQTVFEWCKRRMLPVAFVLAGGYIGPHLDQQGLVELHRLTLSCAAQM
jgi:acetoin utilization deacetylase AcuC-like enzyme